jgi:hypothetical protein
MKSVYKITLLFGITILVSSAIIMQHQTISIFQICMSTLDMTHIPSQSFKNGKEGQLPADGTLKGGFVPWL